MAGNRTRPPIIGTFSTDKAQSPFLTLSDFNGGAEIGGIDSAGYLWGTLAAGDFTGVTQLAGNYAVQTIDNGSLFSVSSSSPVTITLPAIAPATPFYIQIQNAGSGTVTITPNGLQIDGSSSSLTLNSNQGVLIASNGSAYFTQRGIGGSSSNAFAGVNAQTGDYTALTGDSGKLITFTKATAVALTLPASAPSSTWFVYVQNRGAGDLTVNRNGNQIDGGTSNLVLHQNQGVIVYCDGTNYFTERGVSGIGNTNVQTNDYTAVASDTGKLVVMNKATAITLTLPASSPGPTWVIFVQNIGAGTLTIARNGLNIDGAASNVSLTQNQGLVIYSDGTNYFTERGSGSTASNVAIKPSALTGIQFVAVATGNDSNDGLSWGTAKLTIMAAYDALPSSGGTIFIAGQGVDATQWPAATSTSGQGIWIMGTLDPNYASPPAGWRKAKNGANAQVAFIGVPSSIAGQNDSTGNMAGFLGGDGSNPAIWLSGVTGVSFRNLYTQYPKSFAWVGINSNSVKNDNAGGSDIVFEHCGCSIGGQSSSYGPVVSLGPNLFWVRLSDCTWGANSLATDSSDSRCAILVSPGSGNTASGVITVENNSFTGGGGFRYDTTAHVGTGNFTLRDIFMEGTGDSQPIAEIVGTQVVFGTVENAIISDAPNNPPILIVPEGQNSDAIHLINCNNPILAQGPCQITGGAMTGDAGSHSVVYGAEIAKTFPSAKNQQGDVKGLLLSQSDSARRIFAPSLVRFTNNLHSSSQLPATWSAGIGTGVTITPITAPDGTANAALLTSSADDMTGFSSVRVFDSSFAVAAGDYLFIGAWIRSGSSTGMVNTNFGELGLKDEFSGVETLELIDGSQRALITGSGSISCPAEPTVLDGNWQWIWAIAKVTNPATAHYRFTFSFTSANPIEVYAPIFCQIPASSISTVAATTVDTAGNSGATQSGHIVTIKTTTNHGLSEGFPVVISGVSASGYNGNFVVKSIPTATTFTYYNATTGLSTSGSGTVTPGADSEAAEWARQVSVYPDGITGGTTVSTLRGINIAFGGSGDNFLATLDHTALTADRVIKVPNAAGTVALVDATNTWSAQQNFTGDIQVGTSGTAISQIAVFTASLTPALVSANTSAEEEYTVTGIATTDKVFLGSYPAPTAGTVVGGVRASNTNKISINWGNLTGSGKTPAAGTYTFIAVRS